MRAVTPRGDAVAADIAPARLPKLTGEQLRMRRNAVWLNALAVGLYDPVSETLRPVNIRDLAAIFNVTERTIRNGLADARALRVELGRTFPLQKASTKRKS